MNRTRVTFLFVDFFGQTFGVTIFLDAAVVSPTDPLVVAAIGFLNAMLGAVCIRVEISAEGANAGSLAEGDYNTVNDKMVATLVDEDGDPHVYKIPGPKATNFSANHSSVNTSDANIIAWTLAMTTNGASRGGTPLVNLTKGFRGANRRQNLY